MCSPKTMIKIGIGVVVALVAAYALFPSFRPAVIGLAPIAVAAICPISMIVMMGFMNKQGGHGSCHDSTAPEKEQK